MSAVRVDAEVFCCAISACKVPQASLFSSQIECNFIVLILSPQFITKKKAKRFQFHRQLILQRYLDASYQANRSKQNT